MEFLRKTRELPFCATYVLFRLKGSLIAISFVLDERLGNNQLVVTETTKRFGGIELGYSFQGNESNILVIESNQPHLRVSNTGDAFVSGGGIANTGIMLGSTPSAENINYLRVPLENEERIMQFRDPLESLRVAFGPGEYGYAII